MAVDTFEKRKSIIDLARPGPAIPIPVTSGVAANERAHFLGLYSGIALSAPPDAAESVGVYASWRERTAASWQEQTAASWREQTAASWREE